MSKSIINNDLIPEHIAIIMDGNGRWASSRGLPRTEGHKAGVEAFLNITRFLDGIGLKYLTVYAFSTENWKRPEPEVKALMDLLEKYFKSVLDGVIRESSTIKIRVIGDVTKLSHSVRFCIKETEERTKNNKGLTVNIAINYGARDEILKAAEEGNSTFESGLYTFNQPDPDLLIRTGGEKRLSNFMLWQLAYTELYFTDILWPDFSQDDVIDAINDFIKRDRRYGGLSK